MTLTIEKEEAVTDEALRILMQQLPPSKLARVMAAWQIGSGDYTRERDRLFPDDTVASLCAEIRAAKPVAGS